MYLLYLSNVCVWERETCVWLVCHSNEIWGPRLRIHHENLKDAKNPFTYHRDRKLNRRHRRIWAHILTRREHLWACVTCYDENKIPGNIRLSVCLTKHTAIDAKRKRRHITDDITNQISSEMNWKKRFKKESQDFVFKRNDDDNDDEQYNSKSVLGVWKRFIVVLCSSRWGKWNVLNCILPYRGR